TGSSPGEVTIDPTNGNAFVFARVAGQGGTYSGTVIDSNGTVIGSLKLDGAPYYYGPYRYNPVTEQIMVPLFSPNGGTATTTLNAVSTKPPYTVTQIVVPGATSATVAATSFDGNTYVLVLEEDGLHVVQIAADGTQIDKFLFNQGSTNQVLLVKNYLYVV